MRHRFKRNWPFAFLLATSAMIFSAQAMADPIFIEPGDVASLISAIEDANASGVHTEIVLSPSSTYELTQRYAEAPGFSAFPVISGSITLKGLGARLERQEGTEEFRIFYVAESGKLTLQEIELVNGSGIEDMNGTIVHSSGGAIYSNGEVVADHVVIRKSYAFANGSAIFSTNSLELLSSTITEITNSESHFVLISTGRLLLRNTTIALNRRSCVVVCSQYYTGIDARGDTTIEHSSVFGGLVVRPEAPNLVVYGSMLDLCEISDAVPLDMDWNATGEFCDLDSGHVVSLEGVTLRWNQDTSNGVLYDTHPDAAVIDAIPLEEAHRCPSHDQFGNQRPRDGDMDGIPLCDIGAYEIIGNPLPIPTLNSLAILALVLILGISGAASCAKRGLTIR